MDLKVYVRRDGTYFLADRVPAEEAMLLRKAAKHVDAARDALRSVRGCEQLSAELSTSSAWLHDEAKCLQREAESAATSQTFYDAHEHEWTIYMNGTLLRCPVCGATQETGV